MAVLLLAKSHWERIVAHCLDGLPLEACGLLAGLDHQGSGHASRGEGPSADAIVSEVYPTTNAARSARLYTVRPKELLAADRAAEAAGLSLIGVWHSHTHTPAYPSPTDVAQAPDPAWHYVLVSLADVEPVLRSYRIVDGKIEEEEVAIANAYNGD